MDNNFSDSPLPSETPKIPKSGGGKKTTLLVVLLVLMTLAAAFLAWWGFIKPEENNAPTEPAEQAVQETPEEEAPPMTTYTAEVGQFTLNLPSELVVIEKLDGGFEGGPATQISIAKSSDTAGVFTTDTGHEFSIFAVPLSNSSSSNLGDFVESLGLGSTEFSVRQDDIEFADQTARVYLQDAVFEVTDVVFIHDGIGYHITMLGNPKDNAFYAPVESGFSFSE